MGFLASLKGAFDSAKAGIAGEIAKLSSADSVNATLAIIALTAGADGEIEQEEVKMGADFVRKSDTFAAFDRATLASTLTGYYAKATDPILKGDLFDVIRKVKKNPDTARAVVKVGLAIAGADGEFEPAEKEVLSEVCTELGLVAADFKGLA